MAAPEAGPGAGVFRSESSFDRQSSSDERVRRADDVIEALGAGIAQLRVLFLAGGVWLSEGVEIALVSTLVADTKAHFDLGRYQASVLALSSMVGVLVGSLMGGFLGDRIGRRKPIVASYLGVTVFGACTAVARSHVVLVIFRLIAGMFLGIGMAPSQVMLSELTPNRWRMVIAQAGRMVLFVTGYTYSCVIFWLTDRTLQHCPWKLCFLLGAIPPLLLGLLALCLLPESPVYMACAGSHMLAMAEFDTMKRLNFRPDVSTEYDGVRASILGARTRLSGRTRSGRITIGMKTLKVPFRLQMRLIFGSAMLVCTLTLALSSFTANLITFGHAYGSTEVLILADDQHGMSPAAIQTFESLIGYVACVVVVIVGTLVSRKTGTSMFMLLVSVTMATFAWSAGVTTKSWLSETVFDASVIIRRIAASCLIQFIAQTASDIYPTAVLSTGTSVSIVAGRLGSILAPIIYETCWNVTKTPSGFYYAIAILGAVALCINWLFMPLDTAEQKKQMDLEAEASVKLKGDP